MKIMVQTSKDRLRSYPTAAHFDGTKPLRELIIQVLANCRLRKEFRLIFEEDEVIKIKQLLYHFFQEPFSSYGEIGTINNFFEYWLLADFPGAFSAVPLLKGKGKNIKTVAEYTIQCRHWQPMIGHAKYLLASRANATKKDKAAFNRWTLKK